MKTLKQIISEAQVPDGFSVKVPDAKSLNAMLDTVRKNNPALLSKAKAWAQQLSALGAKHPNGVTGAELSSALEMGEPGHDIVTFIKGLRSVASPDVITALPTDARNFVQKTDKFMRKYRAMNGEQEPEGPEAPAAKPVLPPKTDWKPSTDWKSLYANSSPDALPVGAAGEPIKAPEPKAKAKAPRKSKGGEESIWDKFGN